MTDEMEPKLRYKTAMATMKSRYIPIRTKGCIQTRPGYVFDVYSEGIPLQVGVIKTGKVWIVIDLNTGHCISKQVHKTRKAALETFFNTHEFRSWLRIVTDSKTTFGKDWYARESEKFFSECRAAGYRTVNVYD